MVYKTFNGKSVKLNNSQAVIKLVKLIIKERKEKENVLQGGWVKTIDLLRDARNLDTIISINEIKDLSNACSLTISPCSKYIKLSNEEIDNKTDCISCEKDSLWFTKEFKEDWLKPNNIYGKDITYLEISPFPKKDFNKEIKGLDLYSNNIPIIERNNIFYLPIPTCLMEA